MENKEEEKDLSLKELQEKNLKCTDKVISDLKYAFSLDFTDERACRYSGISHDSYYRWINESEEFKEEMQKAKDILLNEAIKVLAEDVKDKRSIESAKWILERRDKKRFSPRQENTGAEGESLQKITIKHVHVDGISNGSDKSLRPDSNGSTEGV